METENASTLKLATVKEAELIAQKKREESMVATQIMYATDGKGVDGNGDALSIDMLHNIELMI